MRHTLALLALIIAFAAANAIAQPPPEEEKKDPDKERLGLRVGYAETDGGLNESFGGGVNLALHWITRIKKPLFVDITFGAFYLGKTDRTDITQAVFGTQFDKVTMRIMTITASPMIEIPYGRTSIYLSGGGGMYVASLILDQDIQQFDLSNTNWGVTAGAGLIRRVSTNWSLDLTFQLHKFWTGTNDQRTSNPDWVYIYSEGDSDPLFWTVTAGVALRLF
jgi:opacity protein-like surface antigen